MTDQRHHIVSTFEQLRLIAIYFGLLLTPHFIYTRIDHRVPMIVDILWFPVLLSYGWFLVRKVFAGKQFRNPDDEQYDVRGHGIARGAACFSMLVIFWGRWIWDHHDELSETTLHTIVAIQVICSLVLMVSLIVWVVMSAVAWRRRRRARAAAPV